jgi:Lon protease-like protein
VRAGGLESGAMDNTLEIPLFPLNLVLYPGMHLPLHIFEDRYKEMINECLSADSEFGVVLLNDDQLCNVGCTAKVTQVYKKHADGKMDILSEGQRRFHVLEFMQRDDSLDAVIEYFDDDSEEVADELLEGVLESYQSMVNLQTKGIGGVKGIFDPRQFSFFIASTTDMALEEKQTLLELTSTAERMRKLEVSLGQIVKQLEGLARIERAASLNGHGKHEH